MAKGLARSGPAPDPNALRRDRDADSWIDLPEGRKGKAPEWPLDASTERELELWRGEWKRPQAVMWERNSQEVEVAMYVRSLVVAEAHDASTAARTLVRQQQEALGLSIPGLARNRWRIPEKATRRTPTKAAPRQGKRRFKVVTGGEG